MKASALTIDITLFKGFTPLGSLDNQTLEKLARHATIQQLKSGNILFNRGETKPQTLFLLEGEIELCSPVSPTQKTSATSEAGRYPIAHSFPRQFTAICVTDVSVLVLPLDILELLPAQDAKGTPTSHGNAWKTQWLDSPMLRNLPNSNKEALLSKMEEIKVQVGQVIIHQDEPADSYFVIKQGKCSVSRRPSPGARDVKLAELTEGQGFGEEALITNVPRNASVTMLNNGILLRLSKQDFIAYLARPLLHHLPFQNAIDLVDQGAVLIDVRSPEEFEIDGLIGSINMPIPVLRLKANRLQRDCTYIVYSNTGLFSSVAAFLLIQQGLKAYVLLGGLSNAPQNHTKRNAYNSDDPNTEFKGETSPPNKVLPFPQNNNSQQGGTSNSVHQASNTIKQQNADVDWNLISDDVLWRSTIGYRQDPGIEAAISATPAQNTTPPADMTLQGFDDIKLFTKIHSTQDARKNSNGVQPTNADLAQSTSYRVTDSNKSAVHILESPNWNNRLPQRVSKRLLFTFASIFLIIGSAMVFFYLTRDSTTATSNESSPITVEQRKLDEKLTKLLDAIQSMSASQNRDKESNNTSEITSAKPSSSTDKNNSPKETGQGEIHRK